MERLFRCVYCNPTEPLNPTPTSDRQLFSTSSKEEEKLVIGHQKYKNDKFAVEISTKKKFTVVGF